MTGPINTSMLFSLLLLVLVVSIITSTLVGYHYGRTAYAKIVKPQISQTKFKVGSKVIPLYDDWKIGQECHNPPKEGIPYVIRNVTVKNNGKVCLQLIGVTASKGARCWEPLWDAHYFKPLR